MSDLLRRLWFHSQDITERLTWQWQHHGRRRSVKRGEPLTLSPLEKRLLMSATPMDPAMMAALAEGAAEAGDGNAVQTDRGATADLDGSTDSETVAQTEANERTARQTETLVFIDESVTDLESLLDDLSRHQPEAEVFVLAGDRDGIQQISEVLSARSEIDAVHVISHSDGDAVRLGSLNLHRDNLAGYAGDIAAWGHALSEDADLLFYGCDLASTDSGRELLDSFAELTGADVAASDDDTGHAGFGADWDLEYTLGSIENDVVFSSDGQQNWRGKLANFTVTILADVLDDFDGETSLREAILAAGDGDTIFLSTGTHVLTLDNGSGDEKDDLDIDHNITIIGQGAGQSIISGEDTFRVFELKGSANATIRGVTIERGLDNNGAGIRIFGGAQLTLEESVVALSNANDDGGAIDSDGTLTINSSRIVGNTSGRYGGGIYSRGTLVINNSSIENNSSTSDGGGIHIFNDTATLTNVTLSGNTSGLRGGGIFNDSNISIVHGTITDNQASDGGGIASDFGTVTLERTIVAGNTAFSSPNPDLQGASYSSNGFNLIGTSSGVIALDITDFSGFAPGLAALADNGGFSYTHALLAGSAAIDAAGNSTLTTDAIGQARPADGDGNGSQLADIGAFELQPVASVITVTTLDDVDDTGMSNYNITDLMANKGTDGEVSIREAIIAANNTSGTDKVAFAIAGSGVRVIDIGLSLPDITDTIIIDGTTQTGYTDKPLISLNGNGGLRTGLKLTLNSGGSTIRGLGIHDFAFNGIEIQTDNNTFAGNWVGGLDPDTGAEDNSLRIGFTAVYVTGGSNTIGGSTVADRNVIGRANLWGILLDGSSASNNNILGNWVGLAPNGTQQAALGFSAIAARGNADSATISGNTIGGGFNGIRLEDSSNNVVTGNFIGVNETGTVDLGNRDAGIAIVGNSENNIIGQSGQGNVIANSTDEGIAITGNSTGNSVRFNRFSNNGALNIDLGDDGADTNDGLDGDAGPNNRQNSPTLTAASVNGAEDFEFAVQLSSAPSQDFVIDIYRAGSGANDTGDPIQHVTSGILTSNASGIASGTLTGNLTGLSGGDEVLVTATDVNGNTSEFSTTFTVVFTNATPVLSGIETTDLSYDENDPAVNITNGLSVADADNATLSSATITIGGFQVGEDELIFSDQLGITGSWNATTGVLALNGTATLADYQTALRSVSYQNSSENPSTSSRTVEFTISDGTNVSATVSRNLTVNRVNDPTLGTPVIPTAISQGQEVIVDTTGISDADGIGTFTYQWNSDGSAIVGATADRLTLSQQEVGTEISVQVQFTDGMGNAVSLDSNTSDPVLNVNDAATGQPAILGTAAENQTLSVDLSGIADEDGLTGVTYSYQWIRGATDITGATADQYVLGDDDVGSTIRVRVSFQDDLGSNESLTSVPTGTVSNVNDPATGEPIILGTPAENQTLSVDLSGIADEDGLTGVTYSYQWIRGATDITGATADQYVLGNDDVGSTIRVRVSFQDDRGSNESRTSAPTSTISNVNDPATGRPVILGNAIENETLIANTGGLADLDGLSSPGYTYQWFRGPNAISGATADQYILNDADVGSRIRVQVSFTDDQGNSESAVSLATAIVTNVNDAPTGLPNILGTTVENQILTADLGGIADQDGLPSTFNYQWRRDGLDVAGANGPTYGLTQIDVGSQMSVAVTFVDGGGTTESLTSAPTASIGDVNNAPTLRNRERSFSFGQSIVVGTGLFSRASTDVDGDTLTAELVSGPTSGTLNLRSDGAFVFTPAPDFFGEIVFVWRANDGQLVSNAATVKIVIAPAINTGSGPGETTSNTTDTDSSEENDSTDDDGGSGETSPNAPTAGQSTSEDDQGDVRLGPGNAVAYSSEPDQTDSGVSGIRQEAGEQDSERSSLNALAGQSRSELILTSFVSGGESLLLNQRNAVIDATLRWSQFTSFSKQSQIWEQLNDTESQLTHLFDDQQLIVGTFGAATGGFTVIALAWLRNGFLVLGLWQQRPLWTQMDPLVLMQGLKKADDEEDESLAEVMTKEKQKLDQENDVARTES